MRLYDHKYKKKNPEWDRHIARFINLSGYLHKCLPTSQGLVLEKVRRMNDDDYKQFNALTSGVFTYRTTNGIIELEKFYSK